MIPPSLDRLAERLRSGELEIATYLGHLEERIGAREPDVAALIDEPGRFERLRREASLLVERFPSPDSRPALYGIPVGVKDIFRVDGLRTGAGSQLPSETFAGPESVAVGRLRVAGALILGKTVSTEFAYFAPGPTRNPLATSRTPGGSSSGSAAAVAAGESPLTLGTQTIGSISRPASFCGVVGYKPSYDRVSRDGVIPLSESLDHVGTFTTSVPGARLAASVLCSEWNAIESDRMPVLGVWSGSYLEQAEPEGLRLFEGVCERLETAGYSVERIDPGLDIEAVGRRHGALVAAEAALVHEKWFERFGDRYHPKTAELLERGRSVPERDLVEARAGRAELRRELMIQMSEHGVDLWISPAARGVAPEGLGSTGDPVMNLPWTHAGLPTVAVPAAKDESGLPLGLQIAGGWWEDERLLGWAAAIERVLGES